MTIKKDLTSKSPTKKSPTKKSRLLTGIGVGTIALVAISISWIFMAKESQATDITVYKSPSCQCCGRWVDHLEKNGFTVTVHSEDDMNAVKKRLGVPNKLSSCHTGVMENYIVEGHVPAKDLQRLLREKPPVKGITAPGMPMGSPGMEIPGETPDHYNVLIFTQDGITQVFANH